MTNRRAASNEPEAPRAQKRKLNVDVILGGTQPPRLSPNQRSPGPDRSTRSGDLGLLLPGLTSLAAPMPALLPPHGASLSQPGGLATPVDIQAIVANLVSSLAQQQPVTEILKQLVLNQLVHQRLALLPSVPRDYTPSSAGVQSENSTEWTPARAPARNLAASEAVHRLPPMRSAGASTSDEQTTDPLVSIFIKSREWHGGLSQQ